MEFYCQECGSDSFFSEDDSEMQCAECGSTDVDVMPPDAE